MKTDRELMQQALEALELVTELTDYDDEVYGAIEVLRERLEQPADEPVAVARVDDLERGGRVRALAMGLALDAPLYTRPQEFVCSTGLCHYKAKSDERLMKMPDGPVAILHRFPSRGYLTVKYTDEITELPDGEYPLYTRPQPAAPAKLWLWKNFVDGKPEYWAFDNPFPCVSAGGDPLTLGEPCGWALLKPSVNGRPDRSEQEVIDKVTRLAAAPSPKENTNE